MKLEFKPVGSAGGYQTLIDTSAGGTWETQSFTATGVKQSENLTANPGQLSAAFRQPIGNLKETFPIKGNQVYADADSAAAAAMAAKVAIMGTKCHWRFTVNSNVYFYANGVVDSMLTDLQGCSVNYDFKPETDLVSTTDPS